MRNLPVQYVRMFAESEEEFQLLCNGLQRFKDVSFSLEEEEQQSIMLPQTTTQEATPPLLNEWKGRISFNIQQFRIHHYHEHKQHKPIPNILDLIIELENAHFSNKFLIYVCITLLMHKYIINLHLVFFFETLGVTTTALQTELFQHNY